MIFNESILKKLITEAWKSEGLHIAKDNDDFILSANQWGIRVNENVLTNKIKGKLVELIGILPEAGEAWLAHKDSIQFEVETGIDPAEYKTGEIMYETTDIMLEQSTSIVRVLKNLYTREYCLINEVFKNLVSMKYLEEEYKEEPAEGPFAVGRAVLWKNTYDSLVCFRRSGDAKADKLLNILTAAGKEQADESNDM